MKVYTGSTWVAAYVSATGVLLQSNNLSDLNSVSTARTNLGLAIGSNVQAWDADLDAIGAITGTTGLLKKTAANTWSLDTNTYLTSAVTSVTGTSPVVSSGGNTPAISIPAATASVNGYMTSTYASKLDGIAAGATANTGTVTSVAALTLGTTGTDVSSTVATGTTTPVITLNIPTSSASNRGAVSAADWTTFNSKQATLVSGTNIKTINSTSLLGSGDIVITVSPALNINLQQNYGGF